MKKGMNINKKLIFYILTTTIIIYAVSIGYVSLNTRSTALKDAFNFTDEVAKEYAAKIEGQFNEDLAVVRTLSYAFKTYKDMPTDTWKRLYADMYKHIFNENPDYYALWDSWELKYIDSTWNQETGRYIKTVWRENGQIKEIDFIKGLDGDSEVYAASKLENLEQIWEPYFDVFDEGKKEKLFMTSLISPLQENGEFMGLVGIDFGINQTQEIISQIKPFENSYAFLLSNLGTFAAHPNFENVGVSIKEVFPEYTEQYNIIDKIQHKQNFSFRATDSETGEKFYYTFASIQVGKTSTPWTIGIVVPEKIIMITANRNFIISLFIGIFGILILFFIILLVAKNITSPLVKTTNILQELSLGKIDQIEKLSIKGNDEIADMAASVNTLLEGLDRTAIFARQIGKGNLNADFEVLSKDDVLGNSLLEMRKNLQHAEEEEEKRKIDDEKQNWITVGIAKFGDILRKNNDNIETLSFHIMSNLINYIEATQGALYIKNDYDPENIYFEMKSTIAFDRSKLVNKKIILGEGLVGRCAFEKLTIYMVDVPNDYVKITSGLGEANPRCVLLVPLILNNDVFGVIELISFNKFEPHKIKFVEKVGENIAGTISSVKVNEQTARLLEESQKQREELTSQEEEMRQNLEEMVTTQEEASKREAELQSILDALNAISLVAEYDTTGRLITINDKFVSLLGIPREQLIGKHQGSFGQIEGERDNDFTAFWEALRNGESKQIIQKITFNNKEIWVQEEYSPIFDNEGETIRILNIAIDITDARLRNKGE
ncbi:MAG: PAS domain-containing protein [Bacteroidales bacterium]|nr:PAS domain-containing protein [Bacteroidales bacterium]